MMGKDITKLQELINQLEAVVDEETKQKEQEAKANKSKDNNTNVVTNSIR